MNKKTYRIACMLLCLVLLAGMLPAGARAAEIIPAVSDNKGDQNYTRYAKPIYSTLAREGSGFMRVEWIDNQLVIERYDDNFSILSQQALALPLPIYGGVYICQDYNFVVCGTTNYGESDSQEVIRILRYNKDWVQTGAASLYGANTTIPFDAGSLRFARTGNYLFIRTCHEMYTAADGYNHQANVTLRVDVGNMTITHSKYDVSNSNWGYSSHSFNQFIQVDGDTLVAADHGDAYPRSVALFRYRTSATAANFKFNTYMVDTLPIVGTIGDNSTGVSMGGLEISDTHYLIAGNTVEQVTGTSFSGQRNIFVTATAKGTFSQQGTTVNYITDYSGSSKIDCSTPHLVKINGSRFFLIWSTGDMLNYCFLNGAGQVTSQIYTHAGALSDCVPIVSGNTISWYVTNGSYPVFYTLDLSAPQSITTVHKHNLSGAVTKNPTDTDPGEATITCSICDYSKVIPMPAVSEKDYILKITSQPSCNWGGYEKVTWRDTTYGTIFFHREIPALGCTGEWVIEEEATCTSYGKQSRTCTRCGSIRTEWLDPLGHDWVETGVEKHLAVITCQRCGRQQTQKMMQGVYRLYGSDRYATAFKTADELKAQLRLEKFQNIIVASGSGFADALAGSYLAAQKAAPILLVRGANVEQVKDYIRSNLAPGGTVYLLGGTAAVPKTMETGLDGFTVKRLGGANRYDTNLLILKEAGVGDKRIIVCTGSNFADSLSASATGLPILLVKESLTAQQKEFLETTSGMTVIVGGANAVSETVENQLQKYGWVQRLAGNTRYETSLLVAAHFFFPQEYAVLAYAQNFPDGLCGGPLAYALGGPLILTAKGMGAMVYEFANPEGIVDGYVLGGPKLIDDATVRYAFSRAGDYQVVAK